MSALELTVFPRMLEEVAENKRTEEKERQNQIELVKQKQREAQQKRCKQLRQIVKNFVYGVAAMISLTCLGTLVLLIALIFWKDKPTAIPLTLGGG